ncbi:hypothetical protein SYJ56_19180 [Algoriphagus sp. D3-2-R+10]|nr:hypothetical protein [Algoriphagus sp. D3-2-R+10]MEB2777446.1 hypothetical protein [Algoriphagus sp. D3-2-R+10]
MSDLTTPRWGLLKSSISATADKHFRIKKRYSIYPAVSTAYTR